MRQPERMIFLKGRRLILWREDDGANRLTDARLGIGAAAPSISIIHHVSRCGSTWLTKMLGSIPGVITVNEPPALNQLLLARLSEQDRQQALRELVGALWQEAMPLASHIVIKTSSWNILKTAELERALGPIPVVFLNRDPIEVLDSLERRPAPWLLDFPLPSVRIEAEIHLARRAARILGLYLDAARLNLNERWFYVEFDELPDALNSVRAHLGIENLGAPDAVALRTALGQHSKRQSLEWVDDRVEKQARVSTESCRACAEFVVGPWDQLRSVASVAAVKPGFGAS